MTVVKICVQCYFVSPGGFHCAECGGKLIHTSDPEADELPESVWKNQRVDYGARRGMVFRFLGMFIGPCLILYGLREASVLQSPWNWVAALASVLIGGFIWRVIHRAAHRGVRVWVLAKGKVRTGRLVRAILWSMAPRRLRRARSVQK